MNLEKNIQLIFSLFIFATCLVNFQLGTVNMMKNKEILTILQFGKEEDVIEPFAVVEIVQQRLLYDKYSNYELDTLQILCDLSDTSKVIRVLDYQTREECGMGWCQRDSIINISIQVITE